MGLGGGVGEPSDSSVTSGATSLPDLNDVPLEESS